MNEAGAALQAEAAQTFAALALEGVCGPGTLCLEAGSSPLGLAVIGRGGACLSLLAGASEARAAAKTGATDFTVDTLSEALRILKNELRQRRPIGVGLVGDAEAVAAEMQRRGVQPDILSCPDATPTWTPFLLRGAVLLDPVLRRGQARMCQGWALESQDAESATARRAGDALLLAASSSTDQDAEANIARQWLQLAPRLFPRDRHRWYWARRMQEQEGTSA